MKSPLWNLTGAAIVLLGMACLAFADDGLVKTLALAEPAPDFNLPGIDGRNHSLRSYADAKLLMIIFTANHCRTAGLRKPNYPADRKLPKAGRGHRGHCAQRSSGRELERVGLLGPGRFL